MYTSLAVTYEEHCTDEVPPQEVVACADTDLNVGLQVACARRGRRTTAKPISRSVSNPTAGSITIVSGSLCKRLSTTASDSLGRRSLSHAPSAWQQYGESCAVYEELNLMSGSAIPWPSLMVSRVALCWETVNHCA